MAIEDYTTYTEVDPNNRFTVTSAKIEWQLVRPEDAYVYDDKGASFFNEDFTFTFSFETSNSSQSGTGSGNLWAVTNIVDDSNGIRAASGDYLSLIIRVGLAVDTGTIGLIECDGGTEYSGSSSADYRHGVARYIKIVRDESVGTYGTLYLYVYSDAARTNEVHSSTLTLHSSKKDFRYLFALLSTAAGGNADVTGFSENLEIVSFALGGATVTTQECTDTTARTSTGHGLYSATGDSSVTQHGHVWDTSANPTTSDSSSGYWGKTENGASPNLGQFQSSITGLTPNTLYYVAAYATNTQGTNYGSDVTITTGTTIGKRYIWTEGTDLHYFDAYSTERVLQGHAVASDKDILPWLAPWS